MMLEQLHKALKKFRNEKDIFDIVLYGSAAQHVSKPRDIDILVLFKTTALRERLAIVQNIKRSMNSFNNLDIQTMLLEELFSPAFFAKTGIFLDGVSLLDTKPFCQKVGFTSHALFVFDLRNKTHSQKVKFNYLLAGRTTKGILDHVTATRLAAGVVQVPSAKAHEFEEILQKHAVQYKRQNVLVQT